MKLSSIMITCLIFSSILSGCANINEPIQTQALESNSSNVNLSNSEPGVTAAGSESESAVSFIPIGKKVKIWYLKYNERNNYIIGLRDQDKRLIWQSMQPVNVFLEENIETSYIERIEDEESGFGIKNAQFNLHILVDAPTNNSTKKNDDGTGQNNNKKKNENDGIILDLIIGGGSW